MTHVGDPKAWFFGKGTYADGTYGTFESQFAMLERMLERYPDRLHLGATWAARSKTSICFPAASKNIPITSST